jgi:hypothetical protein
MVYFFQGLFNVLYLFLDTSFDFRFDELQIFQPFPHFEDINTLEVMETFFSQSV